MSQSQRPDRPDDAIPQEALLPGSSVEDEQVTAAFLRLEEARLQAGRSSWKRMLGWSLVLLVGLGGLGQLMPMLL